jgi:hypothetical protein
MLRSALGIALRATPREMGADEVFGCGKINGTVSKDEAGAKNQTR